MLVGQTRELDVRAAGLAERRRVLAERHAEVERRLLGHAEERATAAARRQRLEDEATALRRLETVVEREHARLDAVFEDLRRDYRDQVDAVRAGASAWSSCVRTATPPSSASMSPAPVPGPSIWR